MSNQSPHPQQRSQQQRKTLRESGGDSKAPDGSFRLRPGIKNFLLFVLAWCMVSVFVVITGIWEFQNDQADTVFVTISVALPALGIIFIQILDH